MMRAPNGSLVRSGKPRREHGRHIFAYCNVNTNQVLYSLTQVLKGNTALKQLPDAGANNNPAKLRKDLWRPLWSVTLPDGKNGLEQGLNAYNMLREYRKLHELNWKPPPELSRPTTQEEMDEIQKQLDERGGSKTEYVHDIIKRRKKKIRQRMVMDQKANSIADLAAVLAQQETDGVQTVAMQKQERDKEIVKMLELAMEASNGRLEQIDAELEALEARLRAKKEGNSDEKSNRSMQRGITALEKQRRRMQFAVDAVEAAEQGAMLLTKEEKEAQARDDSIRLRVDLLKQLIQEKREAESKVMKEQTSGIPESAAEEQIMDEMAQGQAMSEDISIDTSKRFRLTDRMLLLELEMIRRQHGRPESVSKALMAFTANRADINELRELAKHWDVMFRLALSRHERLLEKWRALQTADEAGMEQDSGESKAESYRLNTPSFKLRMRAMEDSAPLLRDLVQMTGGKKSVEEAEAMIAEQQSAHPSDKREFVLTLRERRRGSELKVIGPARAYATVLAKAKVEARADELARELHEAAMTENVSEELAGEEQATEQQVHGEDADVGLDSTTSPTFKEVNEAARQVRRLSARVQDVETVATLQVSEAESMNNAKMRKEVEAKWAELDDSLKSRKIRVSLSELRDQMPVLLPALRQAKGLLQQENGVEQLHGAAEASRERSIAAKHAGHEEMAREQKLKAIMFETVANLREYEDVVLSAPEEELEEQGADSPGAASPEGDAQEAVEDQAVQKSRDMLAERQAYVRKIRMAADNEAQAAEVASESEKVQSPPEQAPPPVDYHTLLPSFPEKTTLPKHVSKSTRILRHPVFSADGVTVRWNNMLDAEYADSWPEAVTHEPMGLSRHTAPKTTEEPIFDVATFKNQEGGGYKGKKWARGVEKKRVREQVKGMTESVLEAIAVREAREEAMVQAEKAEKKRVRAEARAKEQERMAAEDPFHYSREQGKAEPEKPADA